MFSTPPITVSAGVLQAILNAVPTPMFVKDRRHRLILVNDALCEMLGRTRDELIDGSDEFLPPEQREVFWRVDDEVFATGRPVENEEVLTDGAGSLRVIVTRKRPILLPTSDGEQPFIVATIFDVTRFREAEARARYLAQHDALTGLANRAQLKERLATAISAAHAGRGKAAVLLLELGGFKPVNDQHGHPAGDQLLQTIGRRLNGLVRGVDTVARCGSDEFCIVQASIRQPSDALGLAERMVAAISQPVVVAGTSLTVSASVGVALFPDDGDAPETLLHRAEVALDSIKHSGRRGYGRYAGEPAPAESQAWDVEAELRGALASDRLSLAFQPVASAHDGTLRGFEALARWHHPVHGVISPEVFIPVAEKSGLIGQLGNVVLHKACAAAATWPWHVQVAVNVSPAQLEDDDLPVAVQRALDSSGLPAPRLELEMTESALLGGSERSVAAFARLKALGISLALDDFGTGWSSLATLQQFRFDRIKIDRSFVANIETDARSVAIVHAVLNLAQMLDVPVTAEGVEGRAQLLALRQMGCSELQGHYLGRPAPEALLPDGSAWSKPAPAQAFSGTCP